MMMRRILALSMFAALSCSGYRPARFAERPPVTEARDDQPIAVPHWRWVPEPVYLSEVYLHRPLREALDLSPYPDAGDVNSFDEVVRSTWFAPKRVDLGTMARGPDTSGPPRPPFTVLSDSPMTFTSAGFCISDARGQKYEIMVDPSDRPEMRTAAVSVAARLVWALGYNTPPVFIVKATVDDFWRSEGSATDVPAILKSGPPPVNGSTGSQRCRGLWGSSSGAQRNRACGETIPTISSTTRTGAHFARSRSSLRGSSSKGSALRRRWIGMSVHPRRATSFTTSWASMMRSARGTWCA